MWDGIGAITGGKLTGVGGGTDKRERREEDRRRYTFSGFFYGVGTDRL